MPAFLRSARVLRPQKWEFGWWAVPDYQVTVVCSCGVRRKVTLGEAGVCECGEKYDTNRLDPKVVADIKSRAAHFAARRKSYAIQLAIVFLAILVIARSAPWKITVAAIFVSWMWFGLRGVRRLRRTDHEVTRHSL